MTQPTPLEEELRERIAANGPLSFRNVMEAALYHPSFGYYMNLRGFGAEGDFITSPERHPAFGWLLGRQALDIWEALERPRPFRILELGAGSGALAESLVRSLRDHAEVELVYAIDEVSPTLRKVQQERLTNPAFMWDSKKEAVHFIIANEVADALPVHRAVVRNGRLHELLVTLDDVGSLTWIEAQHANEELEAYFHAIGPIPADGSVVDVSLELAGWGKKLVGRLKRGVALVIDYAASPPRDTLLAYYRHTMGSDPLVRLGKQDITAHVDLRTLIRLAIGEGTQASATTQRGLLLNLGFDQVRAQLNGMTDRAALAQLVDANGLGGQIAAVFLMLDMPPGYRPAGIHRKDWPEPHHIPSLPPDQDEADFLSQWREAFAGSQPEEER